MNTLKLFLLFFILNLLFLNCFKDSSTNPQKENTNKVLFLKNSNSYLKITHPEHPEYLEEYEPCQEGGNYKGLTIELLFYCTGNGGYLISKPYGGSWESGNPTEIYSLYFNAGVQPSLEFRTAYWDTTRKDPETQHVASVSENINQNDWNHIAAVYDFDTGTKSIIINGELVYNESGIYFGGCDGNPLYIGASPKNIDQIFGYFNGYIDEIRIWSKVRSVIDIKNSMTKTLKGNESGLVGYWNFDEGTAKDKINSNMICTLIGDASIIEKME